MPLDVNSLLLAVKTYGPLGLFFSSFVGSTVFVPMMPEGVLAGLIGAGADPVFLVLVASLGSLGGSFVNYALGRLGVRWYMKHFSRERKSETYAKLERFVRKYGKFGFFAILAFPAPFPGDILTVAAGIWRMDIKHFSFIVFASKLVRYSFYALLALGFVH